MNVFKRVKSFASRYLIQFIAVVEVEFVLAANRNSPYAIEQKFKVLISAQNRNSILIKVDLNVVIQLFLVLIDNDLVDSAVLNVEVKLHKGILVKLFSILIIFARADGEFCPIRGLKATRILVDALPFRGGVAKLGKRSMFQVQKLDQILFP